MREVFPKKRDTYMIILTSACVIFCLICMLFTDLGSNPMVWILLVVAAVLLVVEAFNKETYVLDHNGLSMDIRIGPSRRIPFERIKECKAIRPSAARIEVTERSDRRGQIRIAYNDGRKMRTVTLKPDDPPAFIAAFDGIAKGRCKVTVREQAE